MVGGYDEGAGPLYYLDRPVAVMFSLLASFDAMAAKIDAPATEARKELAEVKHIAAAA